MALLIYNLLSALTVGLMLSA